MLKKIIKNKYFLRKWLLIIIGSCSVGLGVIGIFVPLLPTAPFLLLAAACYIRSSKKLYNWLINHRWFGNYIKYYREHRALTLKAKVTTLMLLWTVMFYTGFEIVNNWWLRLVLGIISISVSLHILYLKTVTKEMKRQIKIISENK